MPDTATTIVTMPTLPASDAADPVSTLAALWRDADLPDAALARVRLAGTDPLLPSSFAIGTALQASLAAAALAATEVAAARGGLTSEVSVDMADVLRECSGRFTLDGRTPEVWDKLAGLYRCAGGGWLRLHTNFAHHRDGVLALLGLPTGPGTERAAVEEVLRDRPAEAFEAAATARGLVVAALRTPAQWAAHPQAAALAAQPLLDIQRIGDAPPRPWPVRTAGCRPLQGLRVLDLTRILAGPVGARALAHYGADVLRISSPHLPDIEALADTNRGKRSAHVDLATEHGRATLHALTAQADVFLQGYRPGALAARGFSAEALAERAPGLVVVSLSAYGHTGPWSGKRGFDSLVQTATGLNMAEATAFGSEQPRTLPLQALDYGAAWLIAFGTQVALLRQRREGGSWQVRVALAGVGRWLQGLPRVAVSPAPPQLAFAGALHEADSGFGRLGAVPHAARFSGFVADDPRPSMPPGSHPPAWA